jgi:hypothetical protein
MRLLGRPGSDSVCVAVVIGPFGDEYLKAKANGDQPDHLLALAECAL